MRIVRSWFCLLALLALHCGAGCSSKTSTPASQASGTPPVAVTAAGKPRLVIGTYPPKLGDTDFGETKTCIVPIRNDGTAPLRLLDAEKSCSCLEVELPADPIPPGGDAKLIVKWTPRVGLQPGKELPLNVQLKTNEPAGGASLPHLDLIGRINPLVMLVPWERTNIDFQKIQPGDTKAERRFKLVSSRLESFNLKTRMIPDEFDVTVEPLPPGDEIKNMKSGKVVTLHPKQNLRAGSLRDKLLLNFEANGQKWDWTLNVDATVQNTIFQLQDRGGGNLDAIEFKKASVLEPDPKTVRVQFFVPRKDTKLTIDKCEPSFVECTQPQEVGQGLWEFTVRLPWKKDDATLKKIQAEGSFEGRVYLRWSQSQSAVPVMVQWTKPPEK